MVLKNRACGTPPSADAPLTSIFTKGFGIPNGVFRCQKGVLWYASTRSKGTGVPDSVYSTGHPKGVRPNSVSPSPRDRTGPNLVPDRIRSVVAPKSDRAEFRIRSAVSAIIRLVVPRGGRAFFRRSISRCKVF